MKRIGILTSGGDGPGMNAAIRAAVRTASLHDVEMVGYLDGFCGLVRGESVILDDRAVGNIIQRGGTIIRTSRCPDFRDADVRARTVERMRSNGVDGLVVVGGDGSFRGALALFEEHGLPVAGVPGTIDNDVWGTDETIGFHTAVETAMTAIDQVRDTSESTGMMFFVEVMGRTCGAIAVNTALAAGATGVLVPEERDEVDGVVERVREAMDRGKRSHIIVVAEGEELGGAYEVARRVGTRLQAPFRVVVLGHIQRGGRPTARDRVVAAYMGAGAVDALVGGRSGMMIGMQRGSPVEVPLAEVVKGGHPPQQMEMLHLAQRLAG
jgi:6-phosphofructokinase 1